MTCTVHSENNQGMSDSNTNIEMELDPEPSPGPVDPGWAGFACPTPGSGY